jgi:excinuclease ABC subunit B
MTFVLEAPYDPAGDQPDAIAALTDRIQAGHRASVLLGVTGSGKTFTMANVIAEVDCPTLIISHNKTLAAQLYGELKSYFPSHAVEYFISYYDYYQPEAYVPQTDTYIEKDASINEQIEQLRLRTTTSLLERHDVIVVASVSCIYGLGNPRDWEEIYLILNVGETVERDALLSRLIEMQFSRNDSALTPGTFRVRGDVVEIFPAYGEHVLRGEFFDSEIEALYKVHHVSGRVEQSLTRAAIYPAHHFVTTRSRLDSAIEAIKGELDQRLEVLKNQGKLLEAQRLGSRTRYDLEMLKETGFCAGIENYSRHLSGRAPGDRPACLIDYFPRPFLTIVDESHVTIPQLRAMWAGDRSRKQTLVDFGFRLPSALDNRPLTYDEFLSVIDTAVYVSATPAEEEMAMAGGVVVEQLIRPTGLLDPEVLIRPASTQMEDLVGRIKSHVAAHERVLVTTLTKRLAEDIADYLSGLGIRIRYLHSEIDALERVEILRDLRLGEFDVLVGINLLREGLDLPEVSLVAILDADREGFLRSETSLIQTAGRAARNVNAEVVLYADSLTGSMDRAIKETMRRRGIQQRFNAEHGITPKSVSKSRQEILQRAGVVEVGREVTDMPTESLEDDALAEVLREEMIKAAARMDYENAARFRDKLKELSGGELPEALKLKRPKRRRRRW